MADRRWTIRFRTAAKNDLKQAVTWYKHEAPEQVPRFRDEYAKAIEMIATQPYLFPERIGSARCYPMRVFPFGIWYVLNEQTTTVRILAVYHYRRNPDVLEKRI